jgi:hypothetical protein
MGTPEPTPVDEDGFQKEIMTGQAMLAAFSVGLLVTLFVVILYAIRKRSMPQFSLARFILMALAAGGCVLSGLHWYQSVKILEAARLEYTAAFERYRRARLPSGYTTRRLSRNSWYQFRIPSGRKQ